MNLLEFRNLNPIIFLVITFCVGHRCLEDCRCDKLIPQRLIALGECGECSRCWYDLYHYANKFEDYDTIPLYLSNANVSVTLRQMANFSKRVWTLSIPRIPYPKSFEKDDYCVGGLKICHDYTNDIFLDQCKKLAPDLRGPDELSETEKFDPREALKGVQKKDKFDGTNFYPRTCPSFHYRHFFTYYLLHDRGEKKYNVSKDGWNENYSIIKVAERLEPRIIEESYADIKRTYKEYGIPLNKKKFCGFPDVFICVNT